MQASIVGDSSKSTAQNSPNHHGSRKINKRLMSSLERRNLDRKHN